MQILIKNGTVVTALDEYKTDLLIENEKIVAIGSSIEKRLWNRSSRWSSSNVVRRMSPRAHPGGGRRLHRFPHCRPDR